MWTALANSSLMLSSVSFLKAHFQISQRMDVNDDRLLCRDDDFFFCLMEWFKENGRTSQMNYMNVYSTFQDRTSDRSTGKQMLRGQTRIRFLRDSPSWHVIVKSFPSNMANSCYTWRMLYPKWDSLLFWEVCKSPEIQSKSKASLGRWLSS